MANSRLSMLLAVLLCVCGVAYSKDDAYQQLDAKIQTTVDQAIKHQFESSLNTQITKLIDERLPATVTPQVEDTFSKQQGKIVDEVLKIINSQDDDDSSGAVDAERLASTESAAKATEKQVKDLLQRIDSLESTLKAERASTEKFTTSARSRIDSISSLITNVQADQKKQEAAIKKNKEADEKLKKQTKEASSTGGLSQEQVQAVVNTEFGVLKKITDASEKTMHSLQLKIGELKTIIDNPTNGVQGTMKDLSTRVKRFQGELDDVRENVVRQQFKENRDLVNKNTQAVDKATAKLAKQQSKLDANTDEDSKLKKSYEKEKKRLNDLISALTKRLMKLESDSTKNALEKYWTMTQDWAIAANNKIYKEFYVEHIKNFDSNKFQKAALANTQAFADWSWKSGVTLGKYLATKASELTASSRKFLGEFYKEFEPRARKFFKNAYKYTADLANKAVKNAGPAMQDAQRLAMVYSKKGSELVVFSYGEGVVLYDKLHKEAVQQFIDMKLAMDQAVLAATVALVSVLALIASIVLFVVYKLVSGFFSLVCGSCCGRSSKKKSKKANKQREEAGSSDGAKAAKNTSGGQQGGSSRKKKGKKGGQRGKYDTL